MDDLAEQLGKMVLDDIHTLEPQETPCKLRTPQWYSFASTPAKAPLPALIRADITITSPKPVSLLPEISRERQWPSWVSSPLQNARTVASRTSTEPRQNKRHVPAFAQRTSKSALLPIRESASPYPSRSLRLSTCSRSSSVSSISSVSSERSTSSLDDLLATPPSSPPGLHTTKHLPDAERWESLVFENTSSLTPYGSPRQIHIYPSSSSPWYH